MLVLQRRGQQEVLLSSLLLEWRKVRVRGRGRIRVRVRVRVKVRVRRAPDTSAAVGRGGEGLLLLRLLRRGPARFLGTATREVAFVERIGAALLVLLRARLLLLWALVVRTPLGVAIGLVRVRVRVKVRVRVRVRIRAPRTMPVGRKPRRPALPAADTIWSPAWAQGSGQGQG